ncbi:MAG: hypothetical protein ACFE0K_01730 [Alcanivorax sp.]|uniref:hypothetical protein n=1 Tax=Alcanivorax sp. TaxID=1872427 RepID=UPI003DA74C14
MKEIYLEQAKDSDLASLASLAGQEISSIKTDGNNSALTDEGLKYIPEIIGLKELDLEWATQITDRGIEALSRAASLTYIDLSFCGNVSESAISKLKKINHGVTIER